MAKLLFNLSQEIWSESIISTEDNLLKPHP